MMRALGDIERKFLRFAEAHAVGASRGAAMRVGAFSALPGAATADVFGALDIAYAAYILGVLDEISDSEGRLAWAERILAAQGDDGWFRSGDAQKHGVEHVTAYALGGLQILTAGHPILEQIKPMSGLQAQIDPKPSASQPPFALPMLDRVHFWRGSHRAAGIAAIVGALADMGLATACVPAIENPQAWLKGWWAYFASRIDPESGYWRLAPAPLHAAFNLLYRLRHDPTLASMGGAVHLYWISERIKAPMPHPASMIAATAALLPVDGLYEKEPYCIDLDGNFMIGRAAAVLDAVHPAQAIAHRALARNREAVTSWFASRDPENWNRSSHKLPGAFAAVAEADRILYPDVKTRWRDIFAVTWWL